MYIVKVCMAFYAFKHQTFANLPETRSKAVVAAMRKSVLAIKPNTVLICLNIRAG